MSHHICCAYKLLTSMDRLLELALLKQDFLNRLIKTKVILTYPQLVCLMFRSHYVFPYNTPAGLEWKQLDFLSQLCEKMHEDFCYLRPLKTHSTSRNGNVTVFQKSYPYSQVTLKCSSNSSSISGLYWTVTVFHMKFFWWWN